jgi:hypothetical protein
MLTLSGAVGKRFTIMGRHFHGLRPDQLDQLRQHNDAGRHLTTSDLAHNVLLQDGTTTHVATLTPSRPLGMSGGILAPSSIGLVQKIGRRA